MVLTLLQLKYRVRIIKIFTVIYQNKPECICKQNIKNLSCFNGKIIHFKYIDIKASMVTCVTFLCHKHWSIHDLYTLQDAVCVYGKKAIWLTLLYIKGPLNVSLMGSYLNHFVCVKSCVDKIFNVSYVFMLERRYWVYLINDNSVSYFTIFITSFIFSFFTSHHKHEWWIWCLFMISVIPMIIKTLRIDLGQICVSDQRKLCFIKNWF